MGWLSRFSIVPPVAVAGLALLSACGSAGGSGNATTTSASPPAGAASAPAAVAATPAASTSTPAAVTPPRQSGTVALTGLCDRMPVAVVDEWQNAVGMVLPANADGCIEDPSRETPGTIGMVEYTASGQDVIFIDNLPPDGFDSNAQVDGYPAAIYLDSSDTRDEAVFIEVGGQYIHVEMGAQPGGTDQATQQLLQNIVTAVAG